MHDSTYEQAQIYLIYIMMIGVPMFLINRMQTASRQSRILANIIVFIMSLSLAWLMVLVSSFLYVLNGLFVIVIPLTTGVLLYMTYLLYRDPALRKSFVYLFTGYAAAVFAVTFFARIGMSNSTVYVDVIDSVREAFSMSDPERTEHLLLNVLMFIPFGAFYMMMTPLGGRGSEPMISLNSSADAASGYNGVQTAADKSRTYIMNGGAALWLGLTYSALIESLQLALSIGECDMADILGNGLGTLIGVLIGSIVRRFIR